MIRKFAQSALCLALCPLLAAQVTGQFERPAGGVTPGETLFAYRTSMRPDESTNCDDDSGSLYGLSVVPFNVPVELTPVDPAEWANATIGSTVTFRIVLDVIVGGGVFNRKSSYADADAGTLIEGKVIRIREGRQRKRKGRTEPRVKEILVGKRIKLELVSSPADHARFSGIAKDVVIWPVHCVIAVGTYAYLIVGCTIAGGCEI
jgi:hypothetical protein